MPEDTIFAKIAAKEAPAYIIAEDDNYMAFLDIFPQYFGQTIVIPKQPTVSQFSQADTEILLGLIKFGQKVASTLEEKIDNVERTLVVFEGFEVNYLHMKLYPAGSQDEGSEVLNASGEKAPDKELEELQQLLTDDAK